MFNRVHHLAGCVAIVAVAVSAGDRAGFANPVTPYFHGTRDAWFTDAGAIGMIETITFTEHPTGLLTTQYQESHGLEFTSNGGPFIHSSDLSFPHDGFGLVATVFGTVDVWLYFDRPMLAIAADFPGSFGVQFFSDDDLIGSSIFGGPGGAGNFTGFISTTSFNRVRLFDQDGGFGIDDLHFVAQAIPAPGAVAVFLIGAVIGGRRRRG